MQQISSLDQVIQFRRKIEEELDALHGRVHASGGDLFLSILQVQNIILPPEQQATLSLYLKGEEILKEKMDIGERFDPLQISITDDNIEIQLKLEEPKPKKQFDTEEIPTVEHTVNIKLISKLVDGQLSERREWLVCDSDIDESTSNNTATDVTETPKFYVSLKFVRKTSTDSGAEQLKALRSKYEEMLALENMLRAQGMTSIYDVKPLWTPIPKPENFKDKILYPLRFGLGVLETSGKIIYKNRAPLMFIGGTLLFHYRGDDFSC